MASPAEINKRRLAAIESINGHIVALGARFNFETPQVIPASGRDPQLQMAVQMENVAAALTALAARLLTPLPAPPPPEPEAEKVAEQGAGEAATGAEVTGAAKRGKKA